MWAYFLLIGLILMAGVWVLSPLLRSDSSSTNLYAEVDETLEQLELEKEAAYATIRELEFDENMGKISKEDLEILKRQSMIDAAGYLKAIDELKANQIKRKSSAEKRIEDEIEREVSALRPQKSLKPTDIYCVRCGAKSSSLKQFCSSCGARLVKPDPAQATQ